MALGAGFAFDPKVARTFLDVAEEMGATRDQTMALLAAGLVESNMDDIDYGDRDSLGPLQQRPSQGWGTPEQVQDPRYAAREFLERAMSIKDYRNIGDLAQQVQRSAYPGRYQERRGDARWLYRNLDGSGGPGGGGGGGGRQNGGRQGADAGNDDVMLAGLFQSLSTMVRDQDVPLDGTGMENIIRGLLDEDDPENEDDNEPIVPEGPDTTAQAQRMSNMGLVAQAEAKSEAKAGKGTIDSAGDTATGTRARSDPNAGSGSPLAWGGFANGRIPLDELVKVRSNGATHYLEPEMARRFRRARAAARKDGVNITLTDSYRDYAAQERVAREKGLYSNGGLAAVPGTSLHGWARAIDIDEGQQWMARNGARFGFETIDREPWHWQMVA